MSERTSRCSVLVLGGAGFIGSHIARRFLRGGSTVTIIDGLLPHTGAARENVQDLRADVEFIESAIAEVPQLSHLLERITVIVDCMAWTRHMSALDDPIYDLKLNAESHLHVIRLLRERAGQTVIYLGSRGQYGNPPVDEITEDTAMLPDDVQGIHKLAAESYYRVYARLRGLSVVSLRFANCFGEDQPVAGDDIGLVGGFTRDLLAGRCVDVFGTGRTRHLVYVRDVAEVVWQLAGMAWSGFTAFNLSGYEVRIEDLAKMLVEMIRSGTLRVTAPPPRVHAIDIGSARFSEERLGRLLGEIPRTDMAVALRATIAYFRERP
jgi:UDP-glucose 4-epimerase